MPRSCSCPGDDESQTPCCGAATEVPSLPASPGAIGPGVEWLDTPAGKVPRVATELTWRDRLGAFKVRTGIDRTKYAVEPGIYAVGAPAPASPVLVSANYKLSFDHLRSRLVGLDAWIMVLDTKGINVWCAAGKGRFGTDEIVRRIEATRLAEVVSHCRLIVPQLGSSGVCAHEVRKRSGFTVVYGPVRAADITAFIDAGMKATPEMRRVRFPLRDRVVLIPVELVMGAKKAIFVAACLVVLAGLGGGGYSVERVISDGLRAACLFLGAFAAGVVLVPMLLPWLPGRAFSVKGAWLGAAMAAGIGAYAWACPGGLGSWLATAAWLLVIPAMTSFIALNFTGASTYTSLSGVRLETRIALPIQAVFVVAGVGLWLAGRFV